MRLVQAGREEACAQLPSPPRRQQQGCSLAWCALAHAAAAFLGAAVLAGSLPAIRANRAGAHDCPQYGGSILDMPDTTDCRRLLAKLSGAGCLPHYHAALIQVGAARRRVCGAPINSHSQQRALVACRDTRWPSIAEASPPSLSSRALAAFGCWQEDPDEACCRSAASFFDLQCHCWGSQFDHAAVAAVAAVDAACLHHAEQTAAGHQQQQQQQGEVAAAAAGGIQLTRLREGRFAGHAQHAQQEQRPADIRLFAGVLSAGERRDRRDAIRATWATPRARTACASSWRAQPTRRCSRR